MVSSAKLQKHLSRGYVRPVEGCQTENPKGRFQHWVVIPVCDEPELPAALRQWGKVLPDDAAVLLVVNHPVQAADDRKQRNRELLRNLRQGKSCGLKSGQLFWVDAAAPGKELHSGVGEARRIGYDTALSQLDPESLEQCLLVACDGDTLIRSDYWNIIRQTVCGHPECGAFCPGVSHQPGRTPAEEEAIRTYEHYLQDYVDGLRFAGSPYAYHAIGSAIVVRASAYLLAGGMRVCEAGEDFYFLQALRKVTGVLQMKEPVVFPSARPSDRVPFGTGKAMISLLAGEKLPVYPKKAFRELKQLMEKATDENLFSGEDFLCSLSPEARVFLEQNHFAPSWKQVLKNLPDRTGAAVRAFHLWFDALKTYRFIHSFMAEYQKQPIPRQQKGMAGA